MMCSGWGHIIIVVAFLVLAGFIFSGADSPNGSIAFVFLSNIGICLANLFQLGSFPIPARGSTPTAKIIPKEPTAKRSYISGGESTNSHLSTIANAGTQTAE
jgi:hypothetical protein